MSIKSVVDYKPLTEDESDVQTVVETTQVSEPNLTQFKASSFMLGGVSGIFPQLCTLGVNYIAMTMWSMDILEQSSKDVLLVSFVWSAISASISMIIMSFVRNLIVATFHSNENLENWILHMECHFVAGTVTGVCLAWTVTDMILGVGGVTCYFSILTLAVALLCCRLLLWCFSPEENEQPAPPAFLV